VATKPLRFSDLTPARQELLRTFQHINFGYLENLLVRNQEPVFADTPPSILVDVKLDLDPAVIRHGAATDFELCGEFCRLMSVLDSLVNGRISKIEIRNGVPRKALCEQLFVSAAAVES
jgi:hypothetical protein